MTLYVENTALPHIIKFVAGEVLIEGSYEFQTTDEAQNAPLAKELLQYPFTKKVFITANFIAIEKNDLVEWVDVEEELKTIIANHLNSGHRLIVRETIKKRPISFYIEITPNPDVVKFVANQILVPKMFEIKSKEQAYRSPLAEELFRFPFIREVFFLGNYISITKSKEINWNTVSFDLRDYIAQYLQEGKTILRSEWNEPDTHRAYSTMEKEILTILDEYVTPMVAQDGGNIRLVGFNEDTKTVKMLLQGACSGCPSSVITLKEGVENILKNFFPDKIEKVEAING
ncbi:MAG: NifU family protein [Flavobacteriales bacterium AspAUS03]